MPFKAMFSSASSFSFSASRSSAGYRQLLSSAYHDHTPDADFLQNALSSSCTSSSSSTSNIDKKKKKKRTRSMVPVVLDGGSRSSLDIQIFFVDSHILEHSLFQDLLSKSKTASKPYSSWKHGHELQEKDHNGHHIDNAAPIFLDCDAILFEFLIWLVENNDPSLRGIDLNDLIEFYGTESI